MPTAYNSIIYIYKGVPLIKGGTEVLYEYQDNAIQVLQSFIHRTFFQYYYVRENRQYVRIKATMPELEGCNYLAFRNASNGDKWFFGFIDRLVYINDNTVEVEFTIDPFPTYRGDCSLTDYTYVIRNTVLQDIARQNLQPDYMPSSAKIDYNLIQEISIGGYDAVVYFACSSSDLNNLPQLLYPQASAGGLTVYKTTGIKCASLTDAVLEAIQEYNGTIIGAYMCPDWKLTGGSVDGYPMYRNLGSIGGNPYSSMTGNYRHQKIRSGVYNTVILNTSQSSKAYQLELFTNPEQVIFQVVGLMTPCPSVFIYPLNYKGVVHNLAEGIYMKFPAIPVSANAVYTIAQQTMDNWTEIENFIKGGVSGAISGAIGGGMFGGYGSVVGAVGGGVMGALSGGLSASVQRYHHANLAQFAPPTITGSGEPIVSVSGALQVQVLVSRPSLTDLIRIDNYFDYYGYNLDEMRLTAGINTTDGAFLQTGSPMLAGSEVDDILNTRLMNGVKIRRTLT